VLEALERICVNFAKEILQIGCLEAGSTEVERQGSSYDNRPPSYQGAQLIAFSINEAASAGSCPDQDRPPPGRASRWESSLSFEGIHCNLTPPVQLTQAVACAEAKSPDSPFVGPASSIGTKKRHGSTTRALQDSWRDLGDPDLQFFKTPRYKTEVMGASFS